PISPTWSSRTAEYSGRAISKCPGWWADVNMDPSSDVQTYNDIAVFILTGLKAYDPSLGGLMPQLWSSMQNLFSLGDLKDADDDKGSWALREYFLFPAIIPHIVEEFERLKRETTIAKAQSKFKKRLASTPANLKSAEAHDSPENLNPSNEPMEFVEIVWHALTTAFLTKQDVYAAHQKWPPTMGSNDNKSQEMALKSTRTAPEHAQEGLEATTRSNSTTLLTFFDKKRDLETFQDGDQIAGVDDTEQGYLEEAFDQDYEPEDEDERDFNLRGQFDDIDDSKRNELLADADNDVDDMPELTVRFQGDDDYESDDDDSDDEGDEEEEPIVADLDHHQENVDRGTDDIGSLVTDLEDLQGPPEEEIVFEPETPQVAKVTRSGQTYAQAAMSGLNLSQVPKKQREWPLSRSGSSANKNKNRVATRRKHQEREMKPLKDKLKSGTRSNEGSRSTKDSKAILEAQHNLCLQQIGNEMKADYEEHDAILIACCMMQIKAKYDTDKGLNFIQQYYINQGLKKFGDDGKDAVDKELRQMLLRDCFTPESVKDGPISDDVTRGKAIQKDN
ncbi:unnamed protein product, partial [Cylindrotheca closterium]